MLPLQIVLGFLFLVFCEGVVVRDYNRVDFFELDSLDSLRTSFFSSGEVASKSVVLGVANSSCEGLLAAPGFRGIQKHAGGKVVSAVTVPLEESPQSLDEGVCAQLFWYPLGAPLMEPRPEHHKQSDLSADSLSQWTPTLMRTTVRFVNDFPFTVQLFWHEESNVPRDNGMLPPGSMISMDSFLGHVFTVRRLSDDGPGSLVDYMVVDGSDYHIGPGNHLETCDYTESDLIGTQISCEDMEMRADAFAHQVWMDKRLGLNFVQPQLVPAVTEDGFRNSQLPAETYAWLKAWYDEHKTRIAKDEGIIGPCMNQHTAPSEITHITPAEKSRLARELQPILEEWYGKGDLQMTSIYGVRKYTNNSVLRMHVDTLATHVVSAIINVDQAVDKPWELLILDHDDNEHWVQMRPGDMLLYESAKLLHGRPNPMVGERYENIFVHYKPTSGWAFL